MVYYADFMLDVVNGKYEFENIAIIGYTKKDKEIQRIKEQKYIPFIKERYLGEHKDKPLHFKRCMFYLEDESGLLIPFSIIEESRILRAKIPNSMLSNVKMYDCSIENSNLDDSHFINSYMEKIKIERSSFNRAYFQFSTIYGMIIRKSSFNNIEIYGCEIENIYGSKSIVKKFDKNKMNINVLNMKKVKDKITRNEIIRSIENQYRSIIE